MVAHAFRNYLLHAIRREELPIPRQLQSPCDWAKM